ncbi:MAG: hypothetical protein HYV07_18960 [Deltaproteobacteria bacterium]|nr:hypothetical protein [Deltaproteobacteria bacterium]
MSRFLALDLPEDELLAAVAREAAFIDADLDALERALSEAVSASLMGAMSLALGRAGRPESAAALALARARLVNAGLALAAEVVELAEGVLSSAPEVERAEAGYVFTKVGREPLYVEDPIAAYWHRRNRLGPPIRRERGAPGRVFEGKGASEPLLRAVAEGEVAVVGFEPGTLAERAPPSLWIHASGVARTPDFSHGRRWTQLKSMGRAGRSIALAPRDQILWVLPARPRIPADELLRSLEVCFARATGAGARG